MTRTMRGLAPVDPVTLAAICRAGATEMVAALRGLERSIAYAEATA